MARRHGIAARFPIRWRQALGLGPSHEGSTFLPVRMAMTEPSAAGPLATATLNGVEPLADLRDVLQRTVHGHPVNRLDELLPWNWTAPPVNP